MYLLLNKTFPTHPLPIAYSVRRSYDKTTCSCFFEKEIPRHPGFFYIINAYFYFVNVKYYWSWLFQIYYQLSIHHYHNMFWINGWCTLIDTYSWTRRNRAGFNSLSIICTGLTFGMDWYMLRIWILPDNYFQDITGASLIFPGFQYISEIVKK